MPAWYEDDAFWERFYPAMFHEQRWEVAEAEVQGAVGLLELSPRAEVLDFCCGPGRHALALARQGFRVVGIDRTRAYLKRARSRAEAAGVELALVQADVRDFRQENRFDAAVSLYTSFGYFEDPADDRRVLENLYASLRPGGKLLMDMSGKEVLARVFQERSWSEPEPGMFFLEDRRLGGGWEWVENRWVLIQGGTRYEQRFSVRIYSGVELKALLLSVGFASVGLFGSLEGRPYDHLARRLVAVGVK